MEEILDLLRQNARLSVTDIAAMTKKTPEEVQAIIKTLEDDGVILKYAAIVNPEKIKESKGKVCAEIQIQVDNDTADKYIAMLTDTITACVMATNQTYVEALKKDNAFTKEAQQEAFNLTYNAVMAVLTEDAKRYLAAAYGDLTTYITNKIEAEVNVSKIVPAE